MWICLFCVVIRTESFKTFNVGQYGNYLKQNLLYRDKKVDVKL